jgi:hypothetical protein
MSAARKRGVVRAIEELVDNAAAIAILDGLVNKLANELMRLGSVGTQAERDEVGMELAALNLALDALMRPTDPKEATKLDHLARLIRPLIDNEGCR